LTTPCAVVIYANMPSAEAVMNERHVLDERSFAEIVI
jgi:hypothetical protein